MRSYQETPYSQAQLANESMNEDVDQQRGSSMLNYHQINIPSNATLPASHAYIQTQASSRQGRYGSQGKLYISDEQENRLNINESHLTNQEGNHHRSMSLGAHSATAMSHTNQNRPMDANRGADELLAGEITRMQALMGSTSYQANT